MIDPGVCPFSKRAYPHLIPKSILIIIQTIIADNDHTIFLRNSLTSGSISLMGDIYCNINQSIKPVLLLRYS
jgi:hypothetical protein